MPTFPVKAYKNLEFLNSPPARHIRILCEYEETRQRLQREGVHNTIVFFGSARAMSSDDAHSQLAVAEEGLAHAPDDGTALAALERARNAVKLSSYYDAARELARRLTEWSMEKPGTSYLLCSGGGPGIMEAANRGAADVPGGKSVGLGISLPFEPGVNDYVTPELGFEFHYFFTRKLWFLYICKAIVFFPGGFGTMDEMFETLTLVQTGKIRRPLPMVLFGTDYWNAVLRIEAMVDAGTIAARDLDLLHRTDSVDDAFTYITARLAEVEAERKRAR